MLFFSIIADAEIKSKIKIIAPEKDVMSNLVIFLFFLIVNLFFF